MVEKKVFNKYELVSELFGAYAMQSKFIQKQKQNTTPIHLYRTYVHLY